MRRQLAHKDALTIFGNCVLFYKNKPVYMERISPDFNATILDMLSQRREVVPFIFDEFSSPVRRLGFVNIDRSVVYCYRLPVRRYKAGLFSENIRCQSLDINYPKGRQKTVDKVYDLQCVEVADALINKYPSFQEAISIVKDEQTSVVAFDKQFAVDHRYRIWYKTECVGRVTKDLIEFSSEHSHLKSLLKENYAQAV